MTTYRFWKYHALGNDYLIVPLAALHAPHLDRLARALCERHRGIGGDGVLFIPMELSAPDFPLRIFNPDGSEAEKSGNGCRILAAHLWRERLATQLPFTLVLASEAVPVLAVGTAVLPDYSVTLDMGAPHFNSPLPAGEAITIADQALTIYALSTGNPHCILLRDNLFETEVRELGPRLEHHPRFPERTNVQFVETISSEHLKLMIWERGAGYTLASGSSAVAAAALAIGLGMCRSPVMVEMPGGACLVEQLGNGRCLLTGPVTYVGQGEFVLPPS